MNDPKEMIKGYQISNEQHDEIVANALKACMNAIDTALNETISQTEVSPSIMKTLYGVDHPTLGQITEMGYAAYAKTDR